MQLVDEFAGAAVDAGAHADLLEEVHQSDIADGVIVGKDFANIPRVRQTMTLRHAQEQSRKPVGEAASDEQQMVVLELVKQPLGRQVLALQRADELERVFVGN